MMDYRESLPKNGIGSQDYAIPGITQSFTVRFFL